MAAAAAGWLDTVSRPRPGPPARAKSSKALVAARQTGGTHIRFDNGAQTSHMTVHMLDAGARAPMAFSCSVDVSSSMEGARTNEAIAGLEFIFREVMRDTDVFGLQTFESSVRSLHRCMAKKSVDWTKDMLHIHANGGGCTALYDAIAAGLEVLKDAIDYKRSQGRSFVPQQLVITDGEDNNSQTTFEQVRALLASHAAIPGFHFYLVAVGIDAAAAARMQALCEPAHCTFLHARDVGQLREHLQQVAERVRVHLTVRDTDGTTTSTVIEGDLDKVFPQAARVAAAAAPDMARVLNLRAGRGAKALAPPKQFGHL